MSSTLVTLGNGQTIELRPLSLEESLELIYMSSDVLHDALVAWVTNDKDLYRFSQSLMTHLKQEGAVRIVRMFLHVSPEQLVGITGDEGFELLKKAIKLNDLGDLLQTMMVLDTVKVDEVLQLWQTMELSKEQ